MSQLLYIILGLVAGIFAGMFGIGGGVVLIPALVYMFGLTQHQAQGTSLAIMVAPIGLLAALKYYYSGNVRMDMVWLVCLGFLAGGLAGASLAQGVPDVTLRRLFGIFMMIIAARMIFGK